jgi:hypothetical protein
MREIHFKKYLETKVISVVHILPTEYENNSHHATNKK